MVSRAIYMPDPVLQGCRSLYTLRACVCVCVCEKERERESERASERARLCAPSTLCGGGGPSLCLHEHASASLSREMDC